MPWPPAPVDRLHHQAVELVEGALALLGPVQQVGRYLAQDRLLRQVVADQLGT
jgi:hypothetical protein